jgi:hypothetical protein
MQASPFPASTLRAPSADARCTCEHWLHCDCGCHSLSCDPLEQACDVAYRPDEGGITPWGCPDCTPGERMPHLLGCELIGWNVPLRGTAATLY